MPLNEMKEFMHSGELGGTGWAPATELGAENRREPPSNRGFSTPVSAFLSNYFSIFNRMI